MSYRVNLESDPWMGGEHHCPGRVARYTLAIEYGQAILETQTYGNIYRKQRFMLRNLNCTCLEQGVEGFAVLLEMQRGKPIKLLFENREEAEECHNYVFNMIRR